MCYEKRDSNIARECWERDQGGKAMERLTRPGVHVDDSAAKYIGNETRMQYASDRLLELILNGPTLMAFNKDKLRHMMRQLYARLEQYENTGVTPEEIVHIKTGIERVWKLMQDIDEEKLKHIEELVDAENEGRLVELKCVPALKPHMKNTLYIIDDGEVFDDFVTEVIVGENENGEVVSMYSMYEGNVCTENDFGKTVFLTEKDAQAALAADKNDGCKKVNDLYDGEGGKIEGETKDG